MADDGEIEFRIDKPQDIDTYAHPVAQICDVYRLLLRDTLAIPRAEKDLREEARAMLEKMRTCWTVKKSGDIIGFGTGPKK